MVQRWQRLTDNVGRGAAIRTGLVGLVFCAIVAVATVRESSPWPVVIYAGALTLPFFIRRWLTVRVGLTAKVLRVAGLVVVVGAGGFALARGRLWPEGAPLEWPLFLSLTGAVGVYLSAFFWTFSDPRVVRLE